MSVLVEAATDRGPPYLRKHILPVFSPEDIGHAPGTTTSGKPMVKVGNEWKQGGGREYRSE